jgi:hypothetical protein
VTNLTHFRKDEYENAVLEWGELMDVRRRPDAPVLVRWIGLKFTKPRF